MPLRRRSRWRSRASASWASRPSCSCDGSSRPRTTSRGSPSASPRSARRSRSVLSLPCGSPFRRLNHAPTVDHQHLAGYIGGCVGSEIDGGVGDVLGRAPPSERDLRGDALLHRGVEPAAVRGLDPAGTEHVHPDPRRDRVRERPAEGVHASLRRAEHLGVVTLDSAPEHMVPGHVEDDAARGGWVGVHHLDGLPRGERSEEHTSELQSLAYLVCRIIISEKHTSELQSLAYLVCRLLLEKKKTEQARECTVSTKHELTVSSDCSYRLYL